MVVEWQFLHLVKQKHTVIASVPICLEILQEQHKVRRRGGGAKHVMGFSVRLSSCVYFYTVSVTVQILFLELSNKAALHMLTLAILTSKEVHMSNKESENDCSS